MSTPPLRLYSYPKCSTCRKALQWLAERGLTPGAGLQLIDITTDPPSLAELRQALASLGERKRLFNTSGQSYRALGTAAVAALSDAQALVGFKPEEWSAALGL